MLAGIRRAAARAGGGKLTTPEDPFDLRLLPGLKAWYRCDVGLYADTSMTMLAVTGDSVAAWADQSGQGNHMLQATAARRPTMVAGTTAVYSGVIASPRNNVVYFERAQSRWLGLSDTSMDFLSNASGLTTVVHRHQGSDNYGQFVCKYDNTTNNRAWAHGPQIGIVHPTATGPTDQDYMVKWNQNWQVGKHVEAVVWLSGEPLRFYLDNVFRIASVKAASATQATTIPVRVGTGNAVGATDSMEGYLLEVAVFNRALTGQEREFVYRAMRRRN